MFSWDTVNNGNIALSGSFHDRVQVTRLATQPPLDQVVIADLNVLQNTTPFGPSESRSTSVQITLPPGIDGVGAYFQNIAGGAHLTAGGASQATPSFVVDAAGDVLANGFAGDGSQLTDVDWDNLATGPIRRAWIAAPSANRRRSRANSPAVAYRLSRSFSIALHTIVSRSFGMRRFLRRSGTGSLVLICSIFRLRRRCVPDR